MYGLAISPIKDVCPLEASYHWRSAPSTDAGLAHGWGGVADAGGVRRGRGADEATAGAGPQANARAYQHSILYSHSDGHSDSHPDTEAQTYYNCSAAPAATWSPNALAHEYACHGGNGHNNDHS